MTSDIERKVFTIIRNSLITKHRTPTLVELMIRTGRSRQGIEHTLRMLHVNEWVVWDERKPEEIQLLEGGGRPISVSEKYRNFMQGNI